jgi:hypothetical protein
VQDLSAWYNCTTFDFMGNFAFGEAFQCLGHGGEYHFFLETLFGGLALGFQMQQIEWYGLLSLVKPLIPKSFMKPKEDMDRYTEELIDRRVKRGYVPGKTGVFNYLLSKQRRKTSSVRRSSTKTVSRLSWQAVRRRRRCLLAQPTFCARTQRN